MTIAGTYPEKGVRVALDLKRVDDVSAHYEGAAFTPRARHTIELAVDVKTGAAKLQVGAVAGPDGAPLEAALETGDLGFIRQLGMQLWRLAQASPEVGGGTWPRRVQRWRGPK